MLIDEMRLAFNTEEEQSRAWSIAQTAFKDQDVIDNISLDSEVCWPGNLPRRRYIMTIYDALGDEMAEFMRLCTLTSKT